VVPVSMCPNVSQHVPTGPNGFQQVPMGLLKLVGVCVEDSCMYYLYFGTVLYHASQLYVSNIAYTDLLGPKSRILSDVSIIFNIKFMIFFAKTYFAKSVEMLSLHFYIL
jgi:hypothetical protein